MYDLTQGSVHRHLVRMAIPMMIGMFVQGLYLFVDLYFVSSLGSASIAAVGAASMLMFVSLALGQMLNVGAVSLIARAIGEQNLALGNLLFRQTMLMGGAFTVLTMALGYACSNLYMEAITQDPAVIAAGETFLHYYLPGLAFTFVSTAIVAALRAVGVVKPTMLVQLLTVAVNIILAPVLIAGWGTGVPLGVAGAGLASTLSILVGVGLLWFYFRRSEHAILDTQAGWRLDMTQWKAVLAIGFPAGAEFGLMFIFSALVYRVTSQLGTEVQAAFGIGMRIIQAISLPAIALSAAIPAIAGQNLGAKQYARVRLTFKAALQMTAGLMLFCLVLNQWGADHLVSIFSQDAAVIAAGALFIHIVSLNYVTSGIVLCCSGMFQALGNTWPALQSSLLRLVLFAIPVFWLSQQPGFTALHVWLCSAASVICQALFSWWLLRRQYAQRLPQEALA